MVLNNLGALLQRTNVVQRQGSFDTRVQLMTIIHGSLEHGGDPATLIVMRLTFEPQKRSRRARKAVVKFRFSSGDGQSDERRPEVLSIAPKGVHTFDESTVTTTRALSVGPSVSVSVSGAHWVTRDGSDPGLVTGSCNYDCATWTVVEADITKSGIPSLLQVAILLRRGSQKRFQMITELKVDVTGNSFEQALLGRQPQDDPVIFDPVLPPFGRDNHDIDKNNLTKLDITKLFVLQRARDAFNQKTTYYGDEEPAPPSSGDQPLQSDTRTPPDDAFHDPVPSRTQVQDGTSMPAVNPTLPEGRFYVELWNAEKKSAAASSTISGSWSFYCKPWSKSSVLNSEELGRWFSWFKKEVPLSDNEGPIFEAIQDARTTLCSLLVRKSETVDFRDFKAQSSLFEEATFKEITSFFDLTDDYDDYRRQAYGACNMVLSSNQQYQAYIVQTPFSTSGFWSTFLISKVDPDNPAASRKVSGVVATGSDVHLGQIFSEVRDGAEACSYHPLLLPVQLFREYYEKSALMLDKIVEGVANVETKLLIELKQQRAKTSLSKATDWKLVEMSEILHQCSMDLAELKRRQSFEEDTAEKMREVLKKQQSFQLLRKLDRYDQWARSRKGNSENLPNRIESQKNLLFALLSQRDNVVSIGLSREALADSKAMKTLSVMTILFLPGAFVATIFSMDMISFQDSRQQVRIYAAIVVPLTFVLMGVYLFWLWSTDKVSHNDADTAEKGGKQA